MPRPLSLLSVSRKLKLSQLMTLARVVETGSFVRAASELGSTQPAISKAIFELETLFGKVLFIRSNRGVVPTEFGVMVSKRTHSILSELRGLTSDIDSFLQGGCGHVSVGTYSSASADLLPRTIAKLQLLAPDVLVTMRDGTAPHLFPALACGELDVVVGRMSDKDHHLCAVSPVRHESLYEETFTVVAGNGNPLCEREHIHISDLVDAAWIFPLAESPARVAAERLFQEANLRVPNPRVESLSLQAIQNLLAQTRLVALIPTSAALHLSRIGSLRILDIPTTGNRGKVGFSVMVDKEASPATRKFIECLREAAMELSALTD